MNNETKQTTIIAPAGEWQSLLLSLLELMGYQFERPGDREYALSIQPSASLAYPLLLVFTRATDAVRLLEKNSDRVAAAITGTDILYEQGVDPDVILSQRALTPWMARAFLGVFTTPNVTSNERVMESLQPTVDRQAKLRSALIGSTVYTSRPRTTREYFELSSYPTSGDEIDVQTAQGKIEGLWQLNPNNYVNTDISVTGTTAKKNGLRFLNAIEQVAGLGLVKNSQRELRAEEVGTLDYFEQQRTILEGKTMYKGSKSDLADVLEIGTMKLVFLDGYFRSPFARYQYGRAATPIVFDQYLQTLEQAQSLVNTPSSVVRTRKPKNSLWNRVIQSEVSPEVYQTIIAALEAGGYVLLPKAFTDRLDYISTPNRFVGVH